MTPPAQPPTRYGPNATIAPQLNHTTTPASMVRALRGFADFGRGWAQL